MSEVKKVATRDGCGVGGLGRINQDFKCIRHWGRHQN